MSSFFREFAIPRESIQRALMAFHVLHANMTETTRIKPLLPMREGFDLAAWLEAPSPAPFIEVMERFESGHFTFRIQVEGTYEFIFAHTKDGMLRLSYSQIALPQNAELAWAFGMLTASLLQVPGLKW